MESVIKVFNETGDCEIDIDKVVAQWNHLWWMSQYKDKFRLIKYLRKDSPITRVKVGISTDQAQELIEKLELEGEKCSTFRHATSWRK